ncbi:hypothetical protein [Algibacillus agarilyticus]|uniref:hypothetical protein n=1 Tax=Algibacillus agarilyticus TaxID=2234133 RepID=UPI000DD00F5E|nr:hypothetical protein [Algibacillus agarilyticus]
MQIQSGLSSSLYGLQKASDGITQSARNIASDSLDSQKQQESQQATTAQPVQNQSEKPSTVDNLTSLIEDKNNAAANIKALQTQNDVLGSLIDIQV